MIDKKLNKALKLQESGQLREAKEAFKQILKSNPKDFIALFSLGVIVQKNGNHIKALEYFDKALGVKSDFALVWYNRGFVLQAMKRNSEALESYGRALSIDANSTDALVNSGTILQGMGRYLEALENYDRILSYDPNNLKVLNNKGLLYRDTKLYDRAIVVFQRLLQLDPDFDYVLGAYCNALQMACNWGPLGGCITSISAGMAAGKCVCGALELLGISDSPREHLRGAQMSGRQAPSQPNVWRGERYEHDRIRIAYVSPDLQEHPVSHLMAGIFENHDKSRFETTAISLGCDNNSLLRSRLVDAFDRFIEVRDKSSKEIAELLRSLEIDIVVDLAGYTAGSRSDIFAQRPAPVQVNYLGYPGTMGVEYMDYILADRWVIPEADQEFFSEKVVYLPDAYLPTDATVKIAERIPTREEYGLPAEGFVFCSFNHSYKITPKIFDIWMQILKATPGSVLWLMKLNSFAEENLQKEAGLRGVDPGRLIFATRVPNVEDHLARYCLADLFLDTTPYNAHTTASDALFVGLPVLTCMGSAFPGRVASSLLHTIGMQELVVGSLQEYQDLAVRFARDRSLLERVKRKLIRNREISPLFDTKRHCRSLESAFISMWERQQKGESPASFAVEAPRTPRDTTTVSEPGDGGNPGMSREKQLKQALSLQEQGDLHNAAAAFMQLLGENPNDVIALYSLGVISLNTGDPGSSLHYFDRAAEQNPLFPQTWFNRGVVLQGLQRYAEALASFNQALEIDPAYSQAQDRRDALAEMM